MTFEVREVRDPGDVDQAAGLFDDPPVVESTRAFLAQDGNHLLIAYEGREPAGFLIGIEIVKPDHRAPQMFLDELGVAEGFRGRGIGRALVEWLVQLARERRCDQVWTLTDPDNEPAHRTYAGAGGRRDPDQAVFVWDLLS